MGATLDDATAERLLRGLVEADDAPPGYAGVAMLLAAVSDVSPESPAMERMSMERMSMERMTLDAMAEAIAALPSTPPARASKSSVVAHRVRGKIIAMVAASTLVGTAGLAYAGALPGPAQGFASTMLAKIGVTVPGNADSHGAPAHGTPSGGNGAGSGYGQGSPTSDLAHNTPSAGGKGSTICQVASNGQCQAGTHGHGHGQGSGSGQGSGNGNGNGNGSGSGSGSGNGNSSGKGSGSGQGSGNGSSSGNSGP